MARVDKATTAEIRESITAPAGEVYERDGSTAVIAVDGLIVGRGAQMLRHFGIAATGTDEIRAALAAAIASNWIAPAGPDLGGFEEEVAAIVRRALQRE